MSLIIKKEEESPAEKVKSMLTTDPVGLDEKSKMKVISKLFKQAKNAQLDYERLKDEMSDYEVALPDNPDVVAISEINEKYALAQSALSRVTAIEMLAIDNSARWEKIQNTMEGYIEDKRSRLLVDEEIQDLKVRQQDAKVRIQMSKDYDRLSKINGYATEAISFLNMVKVKKKDLASIVINISRQVKVMSLDYEINKKPLS